LEEVWMKASVDVDLCCGCGPCQEVCPQVFRIEDHVARVIVKVVPADAEDACREARERCPTEAISIEE
jgi:ferredoxin